MAKTTAKPTCYEFLGLEPTATDDQIADAVEAMTRRASALAPVAPDRSFQLREQIRTVRRHLLSGPDQRRSYDGTIGLGVDAAPETATPQPAPVPQGSSGVACRSCGQLVKAGDRFCLQCGTGVASPTSRGSFCLTCGSKLSVSDFFCMTCGTPLASNEPVKAAAACPGCGGATSRDGALCDTCTRAQPAVAPPAPVSVAPTGAATEAATTFCTACGAMLREGDRFCTSCGAVTPG